MSLIVIEGLDGSGKGTQYKLLVDNLKKMGIETCEVDFPDYNSKSSALVKMYLGGEFGGNPKEINPYAACTFYAVDRFASYTTNWKKDFESGKTIIANRYISSNIVYQMSKVKEENWGEFIDWVCDLECDKFNLPQADLVIYLDMPTDVSQELMTK
ncbi:MAG: thymidylate kinase, partial [Clostridia bacterium]